MCVVVAGGCWGLIVPSSARQTLGRRVLHPPVGVLPAPSQDFGSPDRPVCCGGYTPFNGHPGCISLSIRHRWPKFAPPTGCYSPLRPLQMLQDSSPMLRRHLFCLVGTNWASFEHKRLTKSTAFYISTLHGSHFNE